MANKRKVEVIILSDIHLGTRGSHAFEANKYLKSVEPGMLIINGDWLDIWNFSSGYWPTEHTENLFIVLEMVKKGIPVYYLTGNHDDVMRQYSDYKLNNFELLDELVLELDGKKYWIFHGDIFDISVSSKARWLAKLGGRSYDYLIRFNSGVNKALIASGRDRVSLSKEIKYGVKKFIRTKVSDFELIACERAITHGYDGVICGHIHDPQQKIFENKEGSVLYLNSGDWVENLTSLEYNEGEWNIYDYAEDPQFKTPVVQQKPVNKP